MDIEVDFTNSIEFDDDECSIQHDHLEKQWKY